MTVIVNEKFQLNTIRLTPYQKYILKSRIKVGKKTILPILCKAKSGWDLNKCLSQVRRLINNHPILKFGVQVIKGRYVCRAQEIDIKIINVNKNSSIEREILCRAQQLLNQYEVIQDETYSFCNIILFRSKKREMYFYVLVDHLVSDRLSTNIIFSNLMELKTYDENYFELNFSRYVNYTIRNRNIIKLSNIKKNNKYDQYLKVSREFDKKISQSTREIISDNQIVYAEVKTEKVYFKFLSIVCKLINSNKNFGKLPFRIITDNRASVNLRKDEGVGDFHDYNHFTLNDDCLNLKNLLRQIRNSTVQEDKKVLLGNYLCNETVKKYFFQIPISVNYIGDLYQWESLLGLRSTINKGLYVLGIRKGGNLMIVISNAIKIDIKCLKDCENVKRISLNIVKKGNLINDYSKFSIWCDL